MNVNKRGFTLIELMVAMVVGLATITSVYSLGSAMSKQFYQEQRVATSQGASRVALMELRRDISRAGLFGTPNASKEATCDAGIPQLPVYGGGNLPLAAFQYYPNADLSVLDPDGVNTTVRADRLRVLTSLYLTDQLLVESTSVDGTVLVLNSGTQAYRRTFAWGQAATPITSGSAPDYLQGTLDWQSAWSGETTSWKGISQKGARAFETGSVLHVESPSGRHFFRKVFAKVGNTQGQVRLQVGPTKLPVGSACLPGAAESSQVAPLQWVEYAIVDPFDASEVGADFFDFEGMFYIDLDPTNPSFNLKDTAASDLIESPNRVLVRRVLDATTGNVKPNTTQIIAEFVTHFSVGFLMDTRSGSTTQPPDIVFSNNQNDVNTKAEEIRAVIIELGVRTPLEDPTLAFGADAGTTRFDVNKDVDGSARMRIMRIEVPVMNIARRNL
jgi:prepilin-type N-terminal cleavage/methylation domain-containing protein